MCVFETHQKVVCLGLLDVKAQAITANKMGALAYIARSMVALLHIVQSAYMGSSFSLCGFCTLGAACISRHVRTLFLHQNRLELSKGVFTGDGSGLG